MAEAEVVAELREPAAAPDPHAVDRVDDNGHEHAHRDERGELPALSHGAGDDRRGRVHEHELEEEEREDADVERSVSERAEEEALVGEDAPARGRREYLVERLNPAEQGDRPEAAELDGETDGPVRQRADAEDDEVRHRHVRGVLRAAEAGLNEHEARLHEEDETDADDHEEHVDADGQVAESGTDLFERRRAGCCCGHRVDVTGDGTGRVTCDGEPGQEHERHDRE